MTFKDGTFLRTKPYRCSGCGYDKESTVVAMVFNDFLKYRLYLPEVEALADKAPYGCRFRKDTDYRGYEGAIGMSCYPRIAEFIGGKMEHVANGKTFDVWRYTDKLPCVPTVTKLATPVAISAECLNAMEKERQRVMAFVKDKEKEV